MTLSCRTTVCPDYRLPEALALVKEAGFAGIELCRLGAESTPVHPDISVRVAGETIQRSGLILTGFEIRPLTGRKADSDERNLSYNLRQLEWDIHLSRALGCHEIAVFGGDPNDEARADLIAGIGQILEHIPDIRLNVGSRPDTCLATLGDYQDVLPQQQERARLLLDTTALLAAGEDPIAVARAFAGRIGAVRLDPQQANLPLAALRAFLEETGYDGPLVVDLPRADDPLADASAARAALRQGR
jgi:sugar phosphate isomerase/epimerase